MVGPPYSILQLHGTFDPGGKEARAVRLMNIWAGKVRHTILQGMPGCDRAHSVIDPDVDVSFATTPKLAGRPGLPKYWALARFMRGFDLVLTYNWEAMDGAMAHRLFHRTMRLPRLIHHEDGFNSDELTVRKARRNVYRRIALASADALVVPSTSLGHIVQAEWGLPADKVRHIPNGIDLSGYGCTRDRSTIPGLRNDGKLVVGTIAALQPIENVRRLLRAVAPVADTVTLVIAAEGNERGAIEAEARALGITDIVMPGHVAHPQDYLCAFDVFALSSDSKQFPVSLVEAMAARLPVVATDVGDVSAMVGAANRPFIVPAADEAGFTAALRILIADKGRRDALGIANRKRAEECFAESAMVERYGRLYREAIEAYRGRPAPV